jgi:hypothetical protein
MTSVFIWGYKEEYPVAKVENSTLSAVEATLTSAELNGIKNGTYDQAAMISVLNKIRASLPNAMVTAYTYSPLVGVTSISPPSGLTEYYKYDMANRLEKIVDVNNKIIKEFKYAYAPSLAGTFYNSYESKIFIRNNCGASAEGDSYTYAVPAGTYSSDLSPLAAQQKALDDININGQNAANTNGTCSPVVSCTFSFSSVIGNPQFSYNSTTTVHGIVDFRLSFSSYGIWQNWSNGVNIGKIGAACAPSFNRIINFTESSSNRQWKIFVDTMGNCTVTLISGTVDGSSGTPLNFLFQYPK